MKMIVAFVLAGCALLTAHAAAPDPVRVASPDGRIIMSFSVEAPLAAGGDSSGKLAYAVQFQGKPVIDESALGLDLGGDTPLGANVSITGVEPGSGVDDYSLVNTKVGHVRDAYNSILVKVAEPEERGGRTMTVEARAYNDGVAFRYVLPRPTKENLNAGTPKPRQTALASLHLRSEKTEFRFSDDDTAWALALPNHNSSYESEYVRLSLSSLSNQGGVPSRFLIGLPVLLHQPGVAWISLMEADLEGNSAMYVTNPSGNWAGHYLSVELSPRWDDPAYAVTGDLPHHSAWRVLGIADDPGRLIESNLETDLSPPNRLKDTSWIHPGKAAWNWWADNVAADSSSGNQNYNTETMKYYVDFAAKSGFPYFLLDAGWSARGDITRMNGRVDIPALVKYAAAKNVKVWIWLYANDVKGQMEEAFPLYEKWGVAGMKIDFVNRDDQQGIEFFYDVARTAAAHHLMVDFHGCHTPWGILREYPNVMSYEGVLGLENNKVGRRDSPVDRTVFAFTRLLAGPMDYTPGAFDNATESEFVARNSAPMAMGTRAQQLALYVVFETPVPMVSDSPQNYEGQPAFQFIKDVPVSWDETRVLNGRPGEFVTIARRHGDEWDLGSITNWDERTLRVPLAFLGAGRYTAQMYEDGPDAATQPKHVTVRSQQVTARSVLTLHLAPGGGAALRFVPKS